MAKDKGKAEPRFLCRGKEAFSRDSLRNFQKETIEALEKMDAGRDKFSTLVNLPTGAGKTRIAVSFCLDVLNKGARVLWIADRIALLEQAVGEFAKYRSEKNYKYQMVYSQGRNANMERVTEAGEEDAGLLKGEPLGKVRGDTDILFASVGTIAGAAEKDYEGFREWIDGSKDRGQKLYVIYDEAHHIGAFKVYDFFASLICKPSEDERAAIHYEVEKFGIIGLTATVYRGDKYLDVFLEWFKDGYDHKDEKLYHIQSEYGSPDLRADESVRWNRIAVVGIKELIKGDEKGQPVLVEPDIIKVSEYKAGRPEKDSEMIYLADRISRHYKKWGKTVVVVSTKAEVEKLRDLLSKKKIACSAYTSGDKDNIKVLSEFRNPETNVKILIVINMLDEGIDIPDLNTLYLYAPTWSQVILRQRMGRVLRKAKDKDKEARVIWQYYPKDCPKLSEASFRELLKGDFGEEPESEEELRGDIVEWRNNQKLPIPPAMYLEPLPEDKIPQEYYYSSLHRLKVLELFGTDMISVADNVGFYYDAETFDDTDDAIYVRDVERKGYRQLLRVLQNDWQTVLRYSDCKDFEQYAGLLGVDEKTLLDDIKQICFYLSDVRKADTSGHKLKKRIFVRDEDIKTFCHWFMTGQIKYRRLEGLGTDANKGQKANGILVEQCKVNDPIEAEYSKDEGKLKQLRDKIENRGVNPQSGENAEKEYTDLLAYGEEGEYIYQEVQSVKSLLRMGAVDVKRIEPPKYHGKEWAFIGKDVKGNEEEVSHVRRRTKSKFAKADWLLIASALTDIPNHIWVTKDDVDEYESKLLEKLRGDLNGFDREQAVKEFLMALGYAKNENIIRRQCEIFGDELPKILQYILYEKAYRKLGKIVRFKDTNGKGQTTCQNKTELQKAYKVFLSGYGVALKAMGELLPVEDVIYDYRPYLKAVPYYQGIKPEFLCRLVNDIVQVPKKGNGTVKRVIDAFGGSGVCTMNGFYKGIKPKQIYNDLGIMNTSFYKCLNGGGLEAEIDKILKAAFSPYDENDTMNYFDKFKDYLEQEKAKAKKKGGVKDSKKGKSLAKIERAERILGRTIKEIEDEYAANYNNHVERYKDGHKKELEAGQASYQAIYLENRLQYVNDKFIEKLVGKKDKELCEACRSVERYLHVFMMKVSALYYVMTEEIDLKNVCKCITEVDLGVLFLLYNTFSNRHFYSDCTIELICDFVNNFKDRLDFGKEQFKSVTVLQKDALKLLGSTRYNLENTVWYLDIPYVETDSTDYVPGWFDIDDFIKGLSNCRGTYIVSSRCNICLPDESKKEYYGKTLRVGSLPDDIADNEVNEEDGVDGSKLPFDLEKELNVFSFYNSFVGKESAREYEEVIPMPKDSEAKFNKNHLPEEKAAKYVLIPYTKMQEDYFKEQEQDKEGKPDKVENNSKISKQYVRRMLAATHFSNIPVEVMITNADIDVAQMPIQKVEEGVYALPTFRTGVDATQYMTEPVVIILRYKKYINILMSLLYHDEYKKYVEDRRVKASAAYFRSLYAEQSKK